MTNDISPEQLDANRENAKLGGVKTQEGKDIVRFNARKHGILSKIMTAYEENIFEQYLSQLFEEYEPQTFMEQVLVERIAVSYLRLFRSGKAENERMMLALYPPKLKPELLALAAQTLEHEGYEAELSSKAIGDLGQVFMRYETSIENRLYKAMHELERLQRIRKGEDVQAPVAVDVHHENGFVSQNPS